MILRNITVQPVDLPNPDDTEIETKHFLLTFFFVNGSDLEQVQTLIPEGIDHETVVELFNGFDGIIKATVGEDDE